MSPRLDSERELGLIDDLLAEAQGMLVPDRDGLTPSARTLVERAVEELGVATRDDPLPDDVVRGFLAQRDRLEASLLAASDLTAVGLAERAAEVVRRAVLDVRDVIRPVLLTDWWREPAQNFTERSPGRHRREA